MFQAAPFNLQISASTPDVFDGRIIAAVPYGTKVKIERADELVIDASLGFSPRGEAAQAIEIRSLTLTSFFIFSLSGSSPQTLILEIFIPASLRSPSFSTRGGISLASLGFSRRGEAVQAIEIRSLTLTSFLIFSLLLKLRFATLQNQKIPANGRDFDCLAERPGFEPALPFWSIRTFQARSFNHSDTSPFLAASWFAVPCWGAKVGIFYGFFNL